MTMTDRVAKALRKANIPVQDVSAWEEVEDGSVEITDRLHVQIGEGYMSVVEENDQGCFEFNEMIEYCKHTQAAAIRSVISEVEGRLLK